MMRFLNGEAQMVVHSDGTLENDDLALWEKKVGHVSLVSREDAEKKAAEVLAGNNELLAWREENWASAQLVDAHLFGSQDRILLMDSDVLIFQRPTEVIDALTTKPKALYWCSDLLNAYSAPKQYLDEILGEEIPVVFAQVLWRAHDLPSKISLSSTPPWLNSRTMSPSRSTTSGPARPTSQFSPFAIPTHKRFLLNTTTPRVRLNQTRSCGIS